MKYSLTDLQYLMQRLRDPDGGCPWDIAQDFKSITSSTVEEAYELVDAIFSDDQQQIKEELGDVLFQVVFYTQMAKENKWFNFDDVIDGLTKKLIRRHPHVFPDGDLNARISSEESQEAVKQQWESIKEQERKAKAQQRTLDDVPRALPALSRAQKMQKRASRVGFDWPETQSVFIKVREEIDELEQAVANNDTENIHEELGDLIFSLVNVARHLKVDAESAVSDCNRKFEQRFAYIEDSLSKQSLTPNQASLEQLDALWEQAKTALKPANNNG